EGDTRGGPFREVLLDRIPASLSPSFDVTAARPLAANVRARVCHQGQTFGHDGFLLSEDEARVMCAAAPENAEVIFPWLGGEELLAGKPARWVIDFHPRTEREARRYALPFARVEQLVRPRREEAAARESARNAD